MKKVIFRTLTILLLVATFAACFCACEKADVTNIPDIPSEDQGGGTVVEGVRVSFYSDGLLYGIAVCAGSAFAMPEEPEKKGYSFAGWFYDEDFTVPFIYEEFVAAADKTDVSLYAAWNKLTDGETDPPVTEDPDDPVDPDDPDDEEPEEPEVVSHTVTFVLDGEIVSTQKVEDGKSAVLPLGKYVAEGNSLLSLVIDGNYTEVIQDETVALSYAPATEQDKELYALGFATLSLDMGSGRFYLESISSDYPFDWLVAPSSWGIFTVYGLKEGAFARVPQLRYVRLGEKYSDIDWKAFSYLPLLEEVEFDPGNASFAAEGLFVTDKSGGELIKYVGQDGGELTVPEGITSLADGVFAGSGFSTVTLPDGLLTIGAGAFANSSFLTEIIMPDSVQSIGERAFENCIMLSTAYFPASLMTAGNGIYAGCVSLQAVSYAAENMPALVKDNGIFDGAGAATGLSLEVGKDVLSLPARLFDGSGAGELYLKQVVFAQDCKVQSIGPEAFAYTDLTAIVIPASVVSLGSDAFTGCASLTKVEYRAANAASQGISGSAFDGAGAEESVFLIGREVVSVPDYLLYSVDGQAGFTMLEFEKGSLENIGTLAFAGTAFAGTVTLPSSLSTIGEGAFAMNGLTAIYVADGNEAFVSEDGVPYSSDGTQLVAYPSCREEISYAVKQGTGIINAYAFAGAQILEEVSISCARVGSFAFYDCESLTVTTLFEGVEEIGDGAFAVCAALEEVVFPSTMRSVGENAFMSCASLRSVVLNDGLERIGSRAFAYCEALGEVDVPQSVTEMGSDVFIK